MGAKAIRLGLWDKHPAYCFEVKCVLESICRFKVRVNVKDSRLIGESLTLLEPTTQRNHSITISPSSKSAFRKEAINTSSLKKITSEIKFTERDSALQQNKKLQNKILPFFHNFLPDIV